MSRPSCLRIKNVRNLFFIYLLLLPLISRASFIESTIGTAVVNDATASYYNPAALTLLKNSQFIPLGSKAYFHSHFSGQSLQSATGIIQTGDADSITHYYLPSFYLGIPMTEKLTPGLALMCNSFNRDVEGNSILRYAESNNSIRDYDLTLSLGYKLTDYFALGAGLSLAEANFLLKPVVGFPALNIPDSVSRNQSSGNGVGGDIGLLLKPTQSTLMGFNYRTKVIYNLNGKSVFEGNSTVVADNYHYKIWTPARSVFSVNQWLTANLGLVGTVQYIQWDIFNELNIFNIATPLGILPQATIPYHFHNSWLFTLGSHYKVTPKWVVRIAANYTQTPSTGRFQISHGDSIVVGGSTGYEINKYMTIDASYAHVFVKNQDINITKAINIITGVTDGSRDGVSLKLTFNIV